MLTGLSAGTISPLRPPGTISTSPVSVIGPRSSVLASRAVFTVSLVVCSVRMGGSSPKASRKDARLLLTTDHLFPGRSVLFEVRGAAAEAVLVAREGAYAGIQKREAAQELLRLPGEPLAPVPPGQEDGRVELAPRGLYVQENLQGRPKPVHVHPGRGDRHHHPVRHGRGSPQDLAGVGRRVDYYGAARPLQGASLPGQAVPLRGQHLEGQFSSPPPLERAPLVVRIQDDWIIAPLFGNGGEVESAGGLPHPTLQIDQRHDHGSHDTVFTGLQQPVCSCPAARNRETAG